MSVSLSADGTKVAIGAIGNDGTASNAGHVRIYNYTPSGTASWTQLGADIDGEAATDYSGKSVSLSADGTKVAIGAYGNDGTASDAGHVRVYSLVTFSPTVTLTDNDANNIVTGSNVVTITATFSEVMASAPTINIIGEVSNVAMTASSTADVWIYPWTVSTTTSGIVTATVSGTDTSGNAYAGTS